VGGIVLVAGVRTVDAFWRRIARRPTPTTAPAQHEDAGTVLDRLLYATLLGAALRLARRVGLPEEERSDVRQDR
jgi:hypothetical protein